MNEKSKLLIIAVSLVVGLASLGVFIGKSLERFRKEDRYIAVKGFSEREVKANFVVWTIKTRITTNNITEGSNLVEENKAKIISFLLRNGIQQNEIVQHNFSVTDKMARDFSSNDIGTFRYIIENSLQVRTEHVDVVHAVCKQTDKLLKAGVLIEDNNDYNPAVKYLFTRLNEIKPEMLAQATQNAKAAASEFAKQSNVSLGKLKKANQGLFSIIDRDYSISSPNSGEGFAPNVNDIYKKVKVVINVEYSID